MTPGSISEDTARDLLDRYGGDLSRWPDRTLARRAAEATLANPALRRHLDAARALDSGLSSLRDSLDAEIASSRAVARVKASILSRTRPRPYERLRWAAAIVAIMLAGGLGSLSDFTIVDVHEDDQSSVVLVDPLVFGPLESE